MPTTRSATKQVKLDDFTDEQHNIKPNSKVASRRKKPTAPNSSTTGATNGKSIPQKRSRSTTSEDKESQARQAAPSKKLKKPANQQGEQQTLSAENINNFEKPIMINRSPVLQLWGAMVAQFLHPELSWEACLSIGNGISALCAIAKGRAIGVINPPSEDNDKDNTAAKHEKEDRAAAQSREEESSTQELNVMGFPMHLKNSTVVIINEKSKGLKESTLRNKFGGDEEYEQVQKAMRLGLDSWIGHEDELERKAFHMYEKFRPNVQQGQQGWGRKGELNPHEMTSVIKRS